MPTLALYDISTDFSCFVASQSSEVQEILGYIQTISPVKTATFSPTKYFNCNIQRSGRVVRAVCFNPAKRPLLEKYQKGRTAVRLHNITSSNKDDIESIIIQNNTTVQPVVVPFVYQDAATSSSLPSLSSLQEVSKEQLVDVKAKVSSITAVKTINSRYGYALQRQEVILVDHTTSIKLILWQEHCNKLEDQKTYALQNLRLKESNGSRYLNTLKSEQFLFKEIPSFTQDLAQVTTEIESLTQRKVSGKIIGVQHASKSLSCTSCKKKVTVKSNGKIANCQSCKMMMRVTSCQPQWFLKVLFQNTQNINDKLALTLFHHEVDKLASFLRDVNLNIISEEDFIFHLLENESSFCITYDTASNKLIEVSLEAI